MMTAVFENPSSGLYKRVEGVEVFLPTVCWDELYPDRVVKIALHAPELLDRNESVYWKVIEENKDFWKGKQVPNFQKIRSEWSKIALAAMKMLEEHG